MTLVRESESDRVYQWYCHILLTFGFILSTVDRHIAAVVAVPMKTALGLSDTQLGLVQGFAFALCYATAAIPIAWLIDRGNRVRIIAICVGVWSVGTAISGMASGFATLLFGRTVTAVSEAGYSPGALSLISDFFARRNVAKATALYMLAPSIGLGLSLICGGLLLGHFERSGGLSIPIIGTFAPWQSVFIAAGIPGLVLAALMVFTIGEPPRRTLRNDRKTDTKAEQSLADVARSLAPFLVPYVLGCTLILLVMFSLAAWSSTFFVRAFNMSASDASSALGPAVLIGGILGPVIASMLVARPAEDRIIERMTRIAVGAGLVTAGTVLLLNWVESRLAATILVTICIMSSSTVAPMVVSPTQIMVPNRLRGRTQAISSFVFTIVAGGIGPTLIGVTTDQLFRDEARLGSSIALVCSISAILGVAAILISRRYIPSVSAVAET